MIKGEIVQMEGVVLYSSAIDYSAISFGGQIHYV